MNAFVITIIMLWENHRVTGGQCRRRIGAVVIDDQEEVPELPPRGCEYRTFSL
jgi:hypothetical protein